MNSNSQEAYVNHKLDTKSFILLSRRSTSQSYARAPTDDAAMCARAQATRNLIGFSAQLVGLYFFIVDIL